MAGSDETLVLDTFSLSGGTNFYLEKLDVPPAKRRQLWAQNPDSDGDALIQQSHYDNVVAPFQLRAKSSSSIDTANDLIATVNQLLAEAEIRAAAEPTVQCLPAGLPAYWTPAGSSRTGILVVQSGTIDERPLTVEGDDAGYFLTNPMPVIRGTLNCLPGVYASVLESVAAVSGSTPTVQISVPNVPGDMLAPTELTITDTVANPGQERKYADWGMDLPGTASGRTNLCTNPKAGAGSTTGWTNSGFPTFSTLPSAPNGLSGSSCFFVSANSAGQNCQFPVTMTSGHTYHCSAYFGPSNTGQWRLDLYNPAGTLKASSQVVTGVASQNGPATRVDLGFTADSTGTWTIRVVSIAGPYSATTLDFNNVLIEEAPSLNSYFDGDSPGASWSGTANNSTSTSSLTTIIDATALSTTNYTGTATTRTGAYNGNNVIRGNPLLPTYQQICATPTESVTGVYQVYARIYALTQDVKIRLKYQVGDGPWRTNDAAVPVLANGFSEVFLGTITIPDTIGGTKPTWVGIVEMNSATIADTCDINFLRLVPASLGSGRLRAPLVTPAATPTIIAYDDMSQSVGNFSSPAATPTVAIVSSTNASPIQITATGHGLSNGNQVVIEGHTVNTNANGAWTIAGVTANTFTLTGSTGNGVGGATGTVYKPGKTAPLGGSHIGTGDPDDFTMDTASKRIVRTALSDSNLNNGRFAIFGIQRKAETTYQDDLALPAHTVQDKEIRGGVFVRYKDTSNWLMAVRRHRYFADTHFLLGQYLAWTYFSLFKSVAGSVTNLGDFTLSAPYIQQGNTIVLGQPVHDSGTFTVRVAVDAAGNVSAYTAPQGADLGNPKITVAQDSDLKTGGALASGGFGIYDATDITSGSYSRYYDNELANSPTAGSVHNDAVIRALKSAVVRTLGKDPAIRQDSTGTLYGRVPMYRGGVRLALPPAGTQNRVPRIAVAVRQNDIDTGASLGMTDSTQIAAVYRACYLTGPGAG